MISLIKTDTIKNEENKKIITGEFIGLSSDTKPNTFNNSSIGNGSKFTEMDTNKTFYFDGEEQDWINEDTVRYTLTLSYVDSSSNPIVPDTIVVTNGTTTTTYEGTKTTFKLKNSVSYSFSFTKEGYTASSETYSINKDTTDTITFTEDTPTSTATLTLTYQDENGDPIVPDQISVLDEYNPSDPYAGTYEGTTTEFTLTIGDSYIFTIRKAGYDGAGGQYSLTEDTSDTITMYEEAEFTEVEFIPNNSQQEITVAEGTKIMTMTYEDENGDEHTREFTGSFTYNSGLGSWVFDLTTDTVNGKTETMTQEGALYVACASGTDIVATLETGYHFDESGNPTTKTYSNIVGEVSRTLPAIVTD